MICELVIVLMMQIPASGSNFLDLVLFVSNSLVLYGFIDCGDLYPEAWVQHKNTEG